MGKRERGKGREGERERGSAGDRYDEARVFRKYEIVRQFRPQWLVKRGTVNINPGSGQLVDYVVVYVDNIRQGDLESLRTITAQSVQEVEHYNTAQAQRLGPRGHPHGAIVVRTKTR